MKTTASRDKGGSSARIESRGERIFDIAVKVIGIVLIILCLYPLYYVIIASISRPLYVENGQVMFTPVMPTLESFREAMEKHPERVVEHAIKGMLPKTTLGRKQGMKLKVYAGPEHPHTAQNPVQIDWRA